VNRVAHVFNQFLCFHAQDLLAGQLIGRRPQDFFSNLNKVRRTWFTWSKYTRGSQTQPLSAEAQLASAASVPPPSNMLYGSVVEETARSEGSLATLHPPPKASINWTLLVICCTRSVITAC
jgi:hypothetical protein